jgi:hypothetical protein
MPLPIRVDRREREDQAVGLTGEATGSSQDQQLSAALFELSADPTLVGVQGGRAHDGCGPRQGRAGAGLLRGATGYGIDNTSMGE